MTVNGKNLTETRGFVIMKEASKKKKTQKNAGTIIPH